MRYEAGQIIEWRGDDGDYEMDCFTIKEICCHDPKTDTGDDGAVIQYLFSMDNSQICVNEWFKNCTWMDATEFNQFGHEMTIVEGQLREDIKNHFAELFL